MSEAGRLSVPIHHQYGEACGKRAGLRLSTSSAIHMNEWQKVESRKEAANDRMWVVTAEQGGYFSQLRTLIGWYELESFSVDGLCDACSIVGGPRNALF